MIENTTFIYDQLHNDKDVLGYVGHRISTALNRRPKLSKRVDLKDFMQAETNPSSDVCVILPRSAAFLDIFPTNLASKKDLIKILHNELEQISTTHEETTILSKLSGQTEHSVDLLHIRTSMLKTIENKAMDLGITNLHLGSVDNCDLELQSPMNLSQGRRERRLTMIAWFAVITGFWMLISAYNHKQALLLEDIRTQDAIFRSALMERAELERTTGTLGALASTAPRNQTATARLGQLAEISAATPRSAWWSNINLRRDTIVVEGTSQNAAETLSGLTSKLSDRRVSFQKTIADSEAGQTFSILIERK